MVMVFLTLLHINPLFMICNIIIHYDNSLMEISSSKNIRIFIVRPLFRGDLMRREEFHDFIVKQPMGEANE